MNISSRKRVSFPLFGLLVVVVALLGTFYWLDAQHAPQARFLSSASQSADVLNAGVPAAEKIAAPTSVPNQPFAAIAADAPEVPPLLPEEAATASPELARSPASTDGVAAGSGAGQPQQAPQPLAASDSVASAPSGAQSKAADSPALQPEAAGGLFGNIYYVFLAGVSVVILVFLNMYNVSFEPPASPLGAEVFKTLSSETRVEMMHALTQRRKTLSELAKEAEISLPGAKQHLELLENAGLVRKLDEGRKWKYYELTVLGKRIIPEGMA
jgi:DNA-binding transcriptional ArsR family regulator